MDHYLYKKKATDGGSLLIFILYVDDMLIAGKKAHAKWMHCKKSCMITLT